MKYAVTISIIILIGVFAYNQPGRLPVLTILKKMETESRNINDLLTQSKVSLCYLINQDNWTTFNLDTRYRRIRVLSNASFKADFNPTLDQRFWYRLHYQILDKDQQILNDQTYYHHTGLTQYRDPETQSMVNTRFYNDLSLKPGDISHIVMNLDNDTDPYYIRFKLAEKDSNMQEVILRVYQEEKTSPQKQGYLWNRLSHDDKKALAKGNVYPHHLMIDQEIYHVLYKKWRPLGPMGVEGKDYQVRRLYIVKEMDIDHIRIQKKVLPEGFLLDVFHHGIVSLPQQKSRVQFQFVVAENQDSPIEKTIKLSWYGAKPGQTNEYQYKFYGDKFQIEKSFLNGLIDISVSHPLVLKVFHIKKDQQIDITPDPLKIKTFVSDKDKPVIYSINHSKNRVTPFRFDFRSFIQNKATQDFVSYALLNKNNKTIKSGKLSLNTTKSLYDRLADDISGIYLSEPARYYFALKRHVKKIKFISEQNVLISAYNRPYRMPKLTRIPKDYHQYNLKDPDRQPTWFAFYPIDRNLLEQNGRSHLVIIQFRPPESREEYIAGKYKWEMFFPESKWRGRYLLLDWDNSKPYRHEMLNTIYQKVPTGKSVDIHFQKPAQGVHVISPDLLFIKKNFERKLLKIKIDEMQQKEYYLSGTRGEISLPSITVKNHKFESNFLKNTSIYINGAGPGSKNIMKRLAKRIDSKELVFKYNKTSREEEVLMFHFFADYKQSRPSTISVHVKGKQAPRLTPLNDWSLCNRRYVITPNRFIKTPVLFTKNEFVGQGESFYLPLGSDLPPGEYALTIKLNRHNTGYLIFSKITLGIFEKATFFRVEGIVNDEMLE
jgi:hypothetical protein